MMRSLDIRVVRPFSHEGRALVAGDRIAVSPSMAAVLHRRRLVTLRGMRPATSPAAALPNPIPEPPAEPVKRRRTYRRRDLVAE